jgi:PilZ domain
MTASLEFPVMLHSSGKTPVMGIIERLSPGECLVRSLVSFEAATRVDFELVVHGGARSRLRGAIEDVRENPPRRHYLIRLDRLPPGEADALERVIAELYARATTARTVQDGGALARASVRVHVDFPVGYALDDGAIGTGSAADLSTGGMLMVCDPLLKVGGGLEVTFRLPEHAGGVSRELVVKSRIVAHQQTSTGKWANHLAFFGVDPAVRTEIAAFIGR